MLCIESTRILQEDQEFGKHGQIQKWSIDYNELNPGYLYYLFALHPGTQITLETIPDLAKAARVTLDRRLQHGGGHTGWSRAWILNMWAFRSVEKAKSRYLWSMPYSPHFFAKHHILLMTFSKIIFLRWLFLGYESSPDRTNERGNLFGQSEYVED